MDAKELGYTTIIIRDATRENSQTRMSHTRMSHTMELDDSAEEINYLLENGINVLDSSSLLREKFKCPENWYQCSLSGNCISPHKQCDKYPDCKDGLDEDPEEMTSDCCEMLQLSSFGMFSPPHSLSYQKYMGLYEKIECKRSVINTYLPMLSSFTR